ncbi:predicted protein [Plenodomus lingam JN3]|uniref:Predicted protein n=1 Tax=Leptosphaeria maculans (strain JN3 / isolate v23.1.3 / race Av1-4-5-6-7-8) TaxID=985895 RepID=E5A967_LEPMJ|nr:predicted protein [Plenodomus lingam JN3]CBY00208.1 predicted protein [Plenodomus lingam JN3]
MVAVDVDSLCALFTVLLTDFSLLSVGVAGDVAAIAADLKSKALPGVLGVLAEEPKDAKAPEPRPNAVEPPVVGDARPPGVKGGIALKGFRPPCDESPANRFVDEKERWWGSDLSEALSECDMDKESLLVLVSSRQCGKRVGVGGDKGAAYLERRVQRFSVLSICSKGRGMNGPANLVGAVFVVLEQGGIHERDEQEATSNKPQATSNKQQATESNTATEQGA